MAGAFTLPDLPAGTTFGSVVHEIFERIDTSRPLVEEVRVVVAATATSKMFDGRHDVLAETIVRAMQTPFGGPLGTTCFADIPPADRLAEMDFEMALAGIDSGVMASDVGRVLDRLLPAGDPLRSYVGELCDASFDIPLAGLINGSIDAVVRLPGSTRESPRLVIADYKTNKLHSADMARPEEAYAAYQLVAAMAEHHYPPAGRRLRHGRLPDAPLEASPGRPCRLPRRHRLRVRARHPRSRRAGRRRRPAAWDVCLAAAARPLAEAQPPVCRRPSMTAVSETAAVVPSQGQAEELRAYCEAGVIAPADVAAARMLVGIARRVEPVEPSTLAWVAMCLALRAPRDGHTCVPLAAIAEWAGTIDLDQSDHLPWPLEPQAWIEALASVALLVGRPGDRTPFILDGAGSDVRLYLARSLAEEQAIAAALLRDGARHVSVLLGGPGSGKTYTLAKDLIDTFAAAETPPRIALAAPHRQGGGTDDESARGPLREGECVAGGARGGAGGAGHHGPPAPQVRAESHAAVCLRPRQPARLRPRGGR